MAQPTFPGTCSFCGVTFTSRTITKHLATCKQRQELEGVQAKKSKARTLPLYHLRVEGIGLLWKYWLHLEVPADATLRDLDKFLRDFWLECCGHLSAFTIDSQRYSVSPIRDPFFGLEERSMAAKLNTVLRPGDKFEYEYDFGTTTELTLKIVGEREGARTDRKVHVLARNSPPEIQCEMCHKEPATEICAECIYSGERVPALFCTACAEEHEHDDMFLPLVNSPRTGECGYTG